MNDDNNAYNHIDVENKDDDNEPDDNDKLIECGVCTDQCAQLFKFDLCQHEPIACRNCNRTYIINQLKHVNSVKIGVKCMAQCRSLRYTELSALKSHDNEYTQAFNAYDHRKRQSVVQERFGDVWCGGGCGSLVSSDQPFAVCSLPSCAQRTCVTHGMIANPCKYVDVVVVVEQ